MASLEDLQQRVALLEGQFEALATIAPGLEHVLLMRDVNVGLVNPLADGDALVWDSTQNGFVNGSSTTATSSFYSGNSGTTVPSPAGANLTWPTLTTGPALLDLSTPTAPTVVTAGRYTFDVTVTNGTPATVLQLGLQAIDIVSTDQFTTGSKFAATEYALSLTADLAAGSVVSLAATQTSGVSVTVTLLSVVVTKTS